MANMLRRSLVLAVAAAGLAACQSDPSPTPHVEAVTTLADYVTEFQYVPFAIPRDNFGAGTIVSFEGKRESIRASNNDCLKLKLNEGFEEARVSLPSSSYMVKSANDLAASLAKGAIENVDLGGAFHDARIKGVSISFTGPREIVVTEKAMDDRVQALVDAQDAGCLRRIFDPKNFVIDRVLSVDSIKVEFKDGSDRTVSLDASLRDAIGLSGQTHANLDGQAGITADTMRMVGYRLWQYTSAGGMGSTRFERKRVVPGQVETVRGAS